jgi:hypothetical protein
MTLDEFYKMPFDERMKRFDELSHPDKMKTAERSLIICEQRRDQSWAWAEENRKLIEAIALEKPEHVHDEFVHKLCKVIDGELKWRCVERMRSMVAEFKAERNDTDAK